MATRIRLVPHTHWDREWYLPFEAFRDRLVHMMDGLIELLSTDAFPHFHLDGQTAMIDDYLEVRPEREDDIRKLVRTGRLSAGPWFTQMDEFLVSGESLIRNLERGLARARDLGDQRPVGYLPDQFGHVGQMPQILARAGIEHAVVWRGAPRTIDRTAFLWEAPDGSRVLAEYLPYGYFIGGGLSGAKDAKELATGLRHALTLLSPMSLRDVLLVSVGGDHHGPDPNLPRLLHEARGEAPDIAAEVGSIADHVDEPVENGLPEWRGELRSAARAHLLPGVYSNRAHQKRERARVEALVERYAEPLAALVPRFTWPQQAIDRIWQLLLWNGAHDSVCGCSVDEVARAVDARYEEARRLADGIIHDALASLGEQVSEAGVLRFNPSPFEREGVPPLGWRVEPSEVPPRRVPVEVAIDDGWIVIDGIRLSLFDEPDVGDLYNFSPVEGAKPLGPTELTANGQRVTARFFNDLEVEIDVSRAEQEPFFRLEGVIRNERPDHRLRLHVALPQEVTRALAGAPFELVERDLVSEGSDLESPSPTWPARGMVLAGGVAILAEGVFEYEVVDGKQLAVTLLRCVGTISRGHLATRPSPAGPDIATPDAQMIGDTHFALGVYASASRRELTREWERFALPLVSAQASGGGSLPSSGSLLEISGAELSSVRRRDGKIEVRMWNASKEPVSAALDGRAVQLRPAAIVLEVLERR